jgi:ribosome recycling factor
LSNRKAGQFYQTSYKFVVNQLDMSDDLEFILEEAREDMKKALEHLETELIKIRAGKASPQMLEGLTVDYYGSPTVLNQVANVSAMDARTLTIQPWEKNMLQPIERAIINANLGVTPQNDGNIIRLFMPPLTEERRKEFVKRAGGEGEQSKVAIRNLRRDALEQIKKLQKDGLSEDEAKDAEKEIQDITDRNIALVEKHLAAKEKEIMAV